MSPIRRETITVVDLPEAEPDAFGRLSRQKIVAQGDEQDPGRWVHVRNFLPTGARISAGCRTTKSGIIHIADIPVTPEGYVYPAGHPRESKLRGVWKKEE